MLTTVEKMFGCVHQQEQVVVGQRHQTHQTAQHAQQPSFGLQDDLSHGSQSYPHQHGSAAHTQASMRDAEEEREMFDTVVAEGMKYKRKCKMLKNALLDLETRCLNEKANVQLQVEEMRQQFERLLSESKAQHFIELTQCREERIQELNATIEENEMYRKRCDELERNLMEMNETLQSTQQSLAEITHAHRESLTAHQNSTQRLREELSSSYESQIRDQRAGFADEQLRLQKELQEVREEKEKLAEDHVKLLQRLNAVVCPDCTVLRGSLAESQLIRDEISYERQRLLDECSYYHEENERLEKQVALMKAEIEKQRSSPDFRNILKSEREQKLQAELQQAKDQILDMQQSIDSIIRSKNDVEIGVKTVLEQNSSLTTALQNAQHRISQLEMECQANKFVSSGSTTFASPSLRGVGSSANKKVSFADDNV